MKHYKRAKAHLDAFVERVDEPVLNWAWEVAVGVLDVIATAAPPPETIEEASASAWGEFFEAFASDTATHVVWGVVAEVSAAVPDEHEAEFRRTLRECSEIGAGATRPRKSKTPPATGLRLVVNNTTRKEQT